LWMKKYHFCHLHGPPDTTSVSFIRIEIYHIFSNLV